MLSPYRAPHPPPFLGIVFFSFFSPFPHSLSLPLFLGKLKGCVGKKTEIKEIVAGVLGAQRAQFEEEGKRIDVLHVTPIL